MEILGTILVVLILGIVIWYGTHLKDSNEDTTDQGTSSPTRPGDTPDERQRMK